MSAHSPHPADPRLRIAIDVTPALRQRAGIGRYTRELVRALVRRNRHVYVLFAADRVAPGALEQLVVEVERGEFSQARPLPALSAAGIPARWLGVLWHRLRVPVPATIWTGPVDLYHATDFLCPPLRGARPLVTIHDLSFLTQPDCAEPGLRRHLARSVPGAVRSAAHVLADSAWTRQDLGTLLDVPESSVTVAYPGVGPEFRRVTDETGLAAVRDRLGLDRPFVLGTGTLEPRKNWPALIDAFGRMTQSRPAGDRRLALVIAGGHGWREQGILEAAERARADGLDVRLLGFVADADLPALYSLAEAFAYPSLYEGFGLPPLEALACGVPAVVSDRASLPEVVGDAALQVPADDPGALAAALGRLLDDDALRERLRHAGPAQAARFTWDACAEAVERGYAAAWATRG